MNQEKDSPAVLKTIGFQTGQPLTRSAKGETLTTSC
jgi:hypothetical protein